MTLCVAPQRVFIVVRLYFDMTQSGNFWIHPRIVEETHCSYRKYEWGYEIFMSVK
jgi:hypothetical protein